jgi:hypothetical protein
MNWKKVCMNCLTGGDMNGEERTEKAKKTNLYDPIVASHVFSEEYCDEFHSTLSPLLMT